MNTPQLFDTLEALRAQRVSAEKRVASARHELADAEVALSRLAGAIESLELLLSPTHEVDTPEGVDDEDDATAVTPVPLPTDDYFDVAPREGAALLSPPPAIEPYASQSGGKRLKSKLMVADLLKRIGEPVSRPRLISEFFDHYGRKDLEVYWARPDNALNTAIDRALAEKMIRAFKDPVGGHAIYVAANAPNPPGRIVQTAMYGEAD